MKGAVSAKRCIQMKGPAVVALEKIIGHTVSDKYKMAVHPTTGDIAYLVGSIICIASPKSSSILRHIFNKSNRNFNSIAFSKDGKYLAAGEATCKQPEILVYEYELKDDPVSILKGHKSGIKGLAFSLDSNSLISIGENGDTRIFLWDWKSSRRVDSKKLKRELNSLSFSPLGDFFVTTSNQNVKFWTIEDVEETKSKTLHCDFGKNVDMGSKKDQHFIDTAVGDKYIYVLSTSTASLCIVSKEKKMIKWMELKAELGYEIKLCSKYLLCVCSDATIRIFDPNDLHHISTLPKPPALGYANILEGEAPIKVPADKKSFADAVAAELDESNNIVHAFYSDRTYICWDIKNLAKTSIKRSSLPHSAPINDIQLCETGSTAKLITCSSDCTIRFWHFTEKGVPSEVKKMVYSKDSYRMIYTSSDHAHFKFQAIQQSMAMNQEGQMRTIKMSPDMKKLVCGDSKGNIKIYHAEKTDYLKEIQSHNGEITCIDFVQDGELILMATGSRDRIIHIYDVKHDFALKYSIEEHKSVIISLAFAVDTQEADPNKRIKLVSCSGDKWIIVGIYYLMKLNK